jgi:membrane-bound lytic murein transglycosylase B
MCHHRLVTFNRSVAWPRIAGAVVVVGCLAQAVVARAQEAAPVPAAAPAPGVSAPADPPPFAEWLKGVREEAVAAGIRAATVDTAFEGLEPLPVVVERDRAQAEFTLSLDQYLARRLTKKLVRDTAAAAHKYRTLLAKVSRTYGVPATIVVSVWALESNLGRFAGVRPTIGTLATLAWDGRRASFFRAQLLDALRILDRGDIELSRLKGSWAGAMGQVQFMPSSYLQYAVDFDGDGRRDIWTSVPDVFASVANYLREHGWKDTHGWGREVRLPADRTAIDAAAPPRAEGCRAEQEASVPLGIDRWRELGVRTKAGGQLAGGDYDAALLDAGARSFLLHPNYGALLQYNCAHAYALSVGMLSDRITKDTKDTKSTKSTKGTKGTKGHEDIYERAVVV